MEQKEGFVYILTNPSFKENWIKIGYTDRTVEERCKELSSTSVPFPFQIFATLKTKQYKEIEDILHDSFDSYRVNPDREFFLIKPERACEILKKFLKILGEESCLNEYDENGDIVFTSYGKQNVLSAAAKGATISKKKKKTKNKMPAKAEPTDKHLFYVKGIKRFADASGYYDESTKSFTVLKGSVITLDVTATFERVYARNQVLKICDKITNGYCLKEDFTFNSHSTAASVVLGSSENGNRVWKDADGKKLIEVYPKK